MQVYITTSNSAITPLQSNPNFLPTVWAHKRPYAMTHMYHPSAIAPVGYEGNMAQKGVQFFSINTKCMSLSTDQHCVLTDGIL